jgi:hypothetical protein
MTFSWRESLLLYQELITRNKKPEEVERINRLLRGEINSSGAPIMGDEKPQALMEFEKLVADSRKQQEISP